MLTPQDFKLPEKFKSFRPNQLEVASKIAVSSKFCYLLDSPTGTGKSLIAATVQRLIGKNVIYCCTTKALQDQLLSDFPYAHTLKGRSNYICTKYKNLYPRITAEDCSKSEANPCEQESQCPYMQAKAAALAAPLAVLNTAYFLTEANFVGTFSGCEYLVIDEADTTEDALMSFVEVLITQRQLDRLEISPPRYKTKFEAWVDWAKDALQVLEPRLASVRNQLEGSWATIDFDLIREERDLSRLVGKLRFFVKEVNKNWVWYPSEGRWSFKPTWIAPYAQNSLWRHAKRVLGMSATILDPFQMSRNIGLDVGSYEYKALPSLFPRENRPIYVEPVANVVNKEMEEALPALARKCEEILCKHPEDHILIHTVSYKIRDYLINHVSGRGRLMTHDAFNRAEILEVFKRSPYPKVLISPSMDRGVDLRDDECRVVVIAKVPYGDLGDPQVNKRVHASKDGSNWYAHHAVSKIIQMSGRGVRSDTDWAVTYILDEQFRRLYTDHTRLFPRWWKEAIVW